MTTDALDREYRRPDLLSEIHLIRYTRISAVVGAAPSKAQCTRAGYGKGHQTHRPFFIESSSRSRHERPRSLSKPHLATWKVIGNVPPISRRAGDGIEQIARKDEFMCRVPYDDFTQNEIKYPERNHVTAYAHVMRCLAPDLRDRVNIREELYLTKKCIDETTIRCRRPLHPHRLRRLHLRLHLRLPLHRLPMKTKTRMPTSWKMPKNSTKPKNSTIRYRRMLFRSCSRCRNNLRGTEHMNRCRCSSWCSESCWCNPDKRNLHRDHTCRRDRRRNRRSPEDIERL